MSNKTHLILTLKEGNLISSFIKCRLTTPMICEGCDLKLWLSYKNASAYNRVVIKECSTHSNGTKMCHGCNIAFKTNPLFSKYISEVYWGLNVNMETKNLNFQNEFYDIDILSNKDLIASKPSFAQLSLPQIRV